ncbi:MAG: lytic transglycosylase domain-containing protein [candidate division WOR-3 bacterium]
MRLIEKIENPDSFFKIIEKKKKKFLPKREIKILYLKSKFYEKLGDFNKKEQIEKMIIKKYRNSKEALEIAMKRKKPFLDIIKVLYNHKKWNEIIEKTENIETKNPEIYFYKGYAYFKLKKYREALEFFKYLISSGYKKEDEVNFYKGLCYLYEGDTLKAFNSFYRNLSSSSKFLEPALREMRLIYLKNKKFHEKIGNLFKEIENKLNEEIIYFYYDTKNYEKLIECLDKLNKKDIRAKYIEYIIKNDSTIIREINKENPLSYFSLLHYGLCKEKSSDIERLISDSTFLPVFDTLKLLFELNLIDDINEKIKNIKDSKIILKVSKFLKENKNYYFSTNLARKYYHFLREKDKTCFDEDFLKILFPTPYREKVLEASKKYNLEPALIYAVMRRESLFDSLAISPKGAKGLMQIMEETAKKIYKNNFNLFKIKDNIEIGSKYLSTLIDSFGLYYGICAYNAGENAVKEWMKIIPKNEISIFFDIPYRETRNYLLNVLSDYLVYKLLYPDLKLSI